MLVPTKVQQPPKIEAYETGISIFDEETPIALERLITTGSNTTTTGVLFTNADTKATSANKIIKYELPQGKYEPLCHVQ